jgi:hypothetical protein
MRRALEELMARKALHAGWKSILKGGIVDGLFLPAVAHRPLIFSHLHVNRPYTNSPKPPRQV